MSRWETLYKKLVVMDFSADLYVPKPTVEAIERFQTQFQFRIPPLAKGFIHVFGAGELNAVAEEEVEAAVATFRFLAPECQVESYDMTSTNDAFRTRFKEDKLLLQSLESPSLFQRLVFFAKNHAGDYFAWDSEDRTSNKPLDYRIYWWPRGDQSLRILSPSFREFMNTITKKDAFLSDMYDIKVKIQFRQFIPLLTPSVDSNIT
jgi:hypothetical protein